MSKACLDRTYLYTRRHSGNYYVQFRLEDGSLSNHKSTETPNYNEARKLAMLWYYSGQIPERINSISEKHKMSELEKVQLIKQLKIYDFEYEDIQTIVDILVSRNFLVSRILKASPESRQAVDYLLEFWDYDKSPYREERPAPISEELRDALLHMADFNPRRSIDKENSFVFFGKNAIKPVNQRLFNKYLNRALEDCGYPNPEKIRFHCWRHAFCTEAKTLINDDRY